MTTIILRHEIQDFDTWKLGYDEADRLRLKHGIRYASLHRDADDPKTVIMVHQFPDTRAAKAFLEDVTPATEEEKEGIVGRLEIWVGEDVESTTYG